jgi:hypothetical protein
MMRQPPPSLESYMQAIGQSTQTASINPIAAIGNGLGGGQTPQGKAPQNQGEQVLISQLQIPQQIPQNQGPQLNQQALQQLIQGEMQKFKSLQEKKASLQHELTMVDQNLMKIQGSLEVFQTMGFIKLN